jgi:hypothetical protein
VVALDDDAPRDVKAKPGALADVLGGVERLERPGQYLGGHPGAGVGDLDDDVPGVRSGRDAERPAGVHGVDGVVDDVRPHLVEVGWVRLDTRHAGAVSADDGHAVSQLLPQHHQGAVDALGDVDELQRGPVELRVGLHGRDEPRNPLGRLLYLRQQNRRRQGACHPFQARFKRAAGQYLACPFAPGNVGPGRRESGSDVPRDGDPVLREPVGERFFPIGQRQRAHAGRSGAKLTTQLVDGDELPGRQGPLGQARERRQQHIAGVLQRPGRAHGSRCRIVDFMRQARRERAERGKRLLLTREGFHVPHRLEEAPDQVHAEREPGARPIPQCLCGDAQDDTGAGPAGGRQVSGLVRPRPEAARPDSRPIHHPGNRLFPSAAAQQLHPPRHQHPPEVSGLALTEEHISAFETHLVAGRDQIAELLVAEPFEQEHTAEIIDEHQPDLPSAWHLPASRAAACQTAQPSPAAAPPT